MTLTPTADEMLDMMERECLMVNVNDNTREVAVYSDTLSIKASSLRGALTQAFRDIHERKLLARVLQSPTAESVNP